MLSTGVFGYISERDRVIQKISHSLAPGGRLAIVDGKRPAQWPKWLFKLFVRISRPFGLTEEYFEGRTWEVLEHYFEQTTFEERYGGLIYISSGHKPKKIQLSHIKDIRLPRATSRRGPAAHAYAPSVHVASYCLSLPRCLRRQNSVQDSRSFRIPVSAKRLPAFHGARSCLHQAYAFSTNRGSSIPNRSFHSMTEQ